MQPSSRLLSRSVFRLSASNARARLPLKVAPVLSQQHTRARTMSTVTTHPSLSPVSTASELLMWS